MIVIFLKDTNYFLFLAHECGLNEEYMTCGHKCKDSCNPTVQTCTANCQVGCFCKDGFARNPKGVCVVRRDCNKCTGKSDGCFEASSSLFLNF